MCNKIDNINDFLLNLNEIKTTEILLEAKNTKIFKSNYRDNKLLIHSFPIIAFSSSDLSKFLSLMLFNSKKITNLFLRTYGIGFDNSNVYIAYANDDNSDNCFRSIETEKLGNEEKIQIILSSLQILKILDLFGYSYNNLKFCSMFYDANNNIRFGCFLPYPIITLNNEDLPIFYLKEKLDVFMFGILAIELFGNMTQTQVLEKFWKFDRENYPFIPESMPFSELIKSCIDLPPSTRPSIDDIYNQIIIKNYPLFKIDETQITRKPINETELIEIYQKFLEISYQKGNDHNTLMFNVLLGSYYIEKNDKRSALMHFQRSMASPISMNNIALLLLKKDPNYAIKLFTEAAEKFNYLVAQKNLSRIYLKGIENPNSTTANQSNTNSDDQPNNNSKSTSKIKIFANPKSYLIDKNEEKYTHYLKMAADQGDQESLGAYMQYLRKHQDINYRKYLLEGAYKGNQKCLIVMQTCFDEGYADFEENPKASKEIARAAALMGNKVMLNYYSEWMKHDGHYDIAFKLLLENAEKGNPVAQLKLSLYYLNGQGVEKNEKEAAKWMKKASDYGLVEAMFNYATMLRDGTGVQKDVHAAETLCIMASKKREMKIMQQDKFGNIEGEFHLPTPYLYFLGYPEEDEEYDGEW